MSYKNRAKTYRKTGGGQRSPVGTFKCKLMKWDYKESRNENEMFVLEWKVLVDTEGDREHRGRIIKDVFVDSPKMTWRFDQFLIVLENLGIDLGEASSPGELCELLEEKEEEILKAVIKVEYASEKDKYPKIEYIWPEGTAQEETEEEAPAPKKKAKVAEAPAVKPKKAKAPPPVDPDDGEEEEEELEDPRPAPKKKKVEVPPAPAPKKAKAPPPPPVDPDDEEEEEEEEEKLAPPPPKAKKTVAKEEPVAPVKKKKVAPPPPPDDDDEEEDEGDDDDLGLD